MPIIFKDNKLEVEDQDAIKLNGVYQGIIAAVYQADNNNFWCYIYIPEVYGKHDPSSNNISSYPRVKIPYIQDSDDLGYIPQIGDVVKVSFDDGNDNEGKFIFIYQIDERDFTGKRIRQANKLYIEQGIISSTPINFEDVSQDMTVKLKPLIEYMYYISLGKTTVSKTDFNIKFLNDNFNTSALDKSFYLPPLMTPLTIVNYDLTEPALAFTISSRLFDMGDFCTKYIKNAGYNSETFNLLARMFDNTNASRIILSDTNVLSDSEKAMLMLQLIAGNSTHFTYDDSKIDKSDNFNNIYMLSKPKYFELYQDYTVNENIYNFLIANINIFKDIWVTNIASWIPAINAIIPSSASSVRGLNIIIAMCLAICPWILPSFLDLGEYLFCSNDIEKTEQLKISFRKPEAFNDIYSFIDNFRTMAKSCFISSSWISNGMDGKFNRLIGKANEIINIYSPLRN